MYFVKVRVIRKNSKKIKKKVCSYILRSIIIYSIFLNSCHLEFGVTFYNERGKQKGIGGRNPKNEWCSK